MRALLGKLVALVTLTGAALLTATVAAPAAHADCLMIGKSDINPGPARLHNYALQMNCDGQLRIRGYVQDRAVDDRHAYMEIRGYRSDGTRAWTRSLTASGYGASTYFDWRLAKVYRMYIIVYARNVWGQSSYEDRWHYNI